LSEVVVGCVRRIAAPVFYKLININFRLIYVDSHGFKDNSVFEGFQYVGQERAGVDRTWELRQGLDSLQTNVANGAGTVVLLSLGRHSPGWGAEKWGD
jgi:hypothetical protein